MTLPEDNTGEIESTDSQMGDPQELQTKLGYSFTDNSLLERALTHRSALKKNGQGKDYERLEFLGDAVLDLTVAHLLIEQHPEAREGELSKMRAALVNTRSLASIAKSLNLSEYIIVSRGELANRGNYRPSILADVFESVIGAIYREAGFNVAFSIIEKLYGEQINTVVPTDPKTELQEALHVAGLNPPEYLLECVEGPEHAPTFVSVVKINGKITGRGRGTTKKASQQLAAYKALSKLKDENQQEGNQNE